MRISLLLCPTIAVGFLQTAVASPTCKKPVGPVHEIEISCDEKECAVNAAMPEGGIARIKKLELPKDATLVLRGHGLTALKQGDQICPWTSLDDLVVLDINIESIQFKGNLLGNAIRAVKQVLFDETRAVTDPVPVPSSGDLLDKQFVDVVRVGDICSGIIVSKRHVLTAAHCAEERWIEAPGGRRLSALGHILHPAADVAVFTVAPRSFSVPSRSRADSPTQKLVTGVVRIVGFGATDSDGGGNDDREKNFGSASVSDWICDADRASRTGCHPEFEFVVRGGGSDSCKGDSGGPLFDKKNGHWRLFGITSRRAADAQTECGDGGIYVHVGTIAGWLDDLITKEHGNE